MELGLRGRRGHVRAVDVRGVDLVLFETSENFLGARDDLVRHPGHLRDVDAVALVGRPRS